MKPSTLRVVAGIAVGVLALGACGSGGGAAGGEGPKVVATVPPIADLVQRVAGDRVEVKTMVPEGQDAHTFVPKPSDARNLAGVELFFDNGYGLNQALLSFASENVPDDVTGVFLGEETVEQTELIAEPGSDCHQGHCHDGAYNAHMWPNIEFAIRYIGPITDALTEADPEGQESYEANAEALTAELEKLHEAAQVVVDSIPEENRKLVVYHDSWSYFARQYGMEVIGAIQPADFSEPSAGELRRMVEQIEKENVPAFFGSEVFPSDVLETIAQESGADYRADLADDDLPGEPGDPEHSYIGLMVSNLRVLAESLGGDASAVDDIDTTVGGSW